MEVTFPSDTTAILTYRALPQTVAPRKDANEGTKRRK